MERGFTLIETVVVAGILVLGVLTLAQLADFARQTGFAARTRTTLVLLAQQKLEEIRARPFADLEAAPAGVEFFDAAGMPCCPGAVAPCADAVFSRRWSAVPVAVGTLAVFMTTARLGPAAQQSTFVSAKSRRTP